MSEKREWMTEPIKKFGDIAPMEERIKRHLPKDVFPTRQVLPTPELEVMRGTDPTFTIKRVK